MFFAEPKDPDVSDRYGVILDDKWLAGETIVSAIFTPPVDSGLIVTGLSLLESPKISALFSGGNVGFWPIHIRIETPTRQREICATLWVKQGC